MIEQAIKEFEIEECMDVVNKVLRRFKRRDREIFEFIYGINGRDRKTKMELMVIYDLTLQRVNQIKHDILDAIRWQFIDEEI